MTFTSRQAHVEMEADQPGNTSKVTAALRDITVEQGYVRETSGT